MIDHLLEDGFGADAIVAYTTISAARVLYQDFDPGRNLEIEEDFGTTRVYPDGKTSIRAETIPTKSNFVIDTFMEPELGYYHTVVRGTGILIDSEYYVPVPKSRRGDDSQSNQNRALLVHVYILALYRYFENRQKNPISGIQSTLNETRQSGFIALCKFLVRRMGQQSLKAVAARVILRRDYKLKFIRPGTMPDDNTVAFLKEFRDRKLI